MVDESPTAEPADYAGDLSPTEAWKLLAIEAQAQLIDVRTDAEWTYVGLPDLAGVNREPILLNWQIFPAMQVHDRFVAELKEREFDRDCPLLFLCRSGVRSKHAAVAMTRAGYTACYNIAEGFEGDKDAQGHRGQVGGWKCHGLPWQQK